MIKVTSRDKPLVVDILSASFYDNRSVNYSIKQDSKKNQRIKSLMSYSFDVCYTFGQVLMSDEKKAVALLLFPDKKKTDFKTVFWDLKLIYNSIGLANIFKTLAKEKAIKSMYPSTPISYLWFLGTDPLYQKKGIGSTLLTKIIQENDILKRPIYLETSMPDNIPFYKKYGFEVYHELPLSVFNLYMLRRNRSE